MSLNGQNLDHGSWSPSIASKFMTGGQYAQKRVIEWFQKQGLDVVKLMEDVDQVAPQNAIESVKQEIAFHEMVDELMRFLMDEYHADCAWWSGMEMLIAAAVMSGRHEVIYAFEELVNDGKYPLSEETGYDRIRESEGAVESLQHVLKVLEEQALAHDFLHSNRSLHFSVPSDMFPGLSYHLPAAWEEGGNPVRGKEPEIVLRELAEHSPGKYYLKTLDELRAK